MTCTATSKKGAPCPRQALDGRERCHLHDPEATRARAKLGGRPRATTSPRDAESLTVEPDLRTHEGITRTLHDTAVALAQGRITAPGAGAMVRLCNVALESLDTQLRDDLEAVEAVLRETHPHLMPRKR